MKRLAVLMALGLGASLTLGARAAAAQTPDGATVYRQHCRTCHGPTGKPAARMASLYPKLPNLTDSTLMAGLTVDGIVNVLKKGQGDMKPFAEKLSAAEMTAVAEYVKTLPGAHAP
jgi:mono/diheme cytochrome c family protein